MENSQALRDLTNFPKGGGRMLDRREDSRPSQTFGTYVKLCRRSSETARTAPRSTLAGHKRSGTTQR